MRIAYFTAYYFSTYFGPARLVENLRDYHGKQIFIDFFTDEHLAGTRREFLIKKISFLNKLPGYWIVRSWLFYSTFQKKRSNYDVVICSNAFEALFFTLFRIKIPLVVLINDDNFLLIKSNFLIAFKYQRIKKIFSNLLGFYIEKFVSKRAKAIWTCSEYLREVVIDKYNIVSKKVEILYPAVDTSYFSTLKKENHEKKSIFFMKRDWHRGGLEILLEALTKTKIRDNLSLTIAGIPEKEHGSVRSLVKKKAFRGKVQFLGIIEVAKVRATFYKSDLFVLPSWQEAFGISLLEAMSTGTPVIASKTGGIIEVLNNGKSGLLFEKGNSDELAQCIDTIIENEGLRIEKINSGLSQAKKFNKTTLFSNFENLCNKLMNEQRNP